VLLGDKSSINTKPQLEIYADDVKCTHGTTTGRLNEEALFYLQARGLNKDLARKVLLQAFANEVIDTIKDEPLKAYIEQRTQGHIV
jgi:Fe-S cluster assembly protein SufD